MASLLAWRDHWLLGIDHIDDDHREMVRLFNRVIEASKDPTRSRHEPKRNTVSGASDVLDGLQTLIDQLRRHFMVEEAFLRSIGYPEFSAHRSEHALYIAELVDLHRRLAITKAPRIDDESLESMKEWLFDHIDEDRGFADYYHQQQRARAARSRHAGEHRGHAATAPLPPGVPAAAIGSGIQSGPAGHLVMRGAASRA